jgi:hypothetical protein
MKKLLIFSSLVLFSFGLGCSSKLNNSIEIRNLAWGELHFNFRGESITVPAGNAREQVVTLKELPKGLFEYSTTFEIPANATNTAAQGDVSGTVNINAGTKILILYSSTFIEGSYTLFATLSTNEPIETDDNSVTP